MLRKAAILAPAVLLFSAWILPLAGQIVTGTILGTVVDPKGRGHT